MTTTAAYVAARAEAALDAAEADNAAATAAHDELVTARMSLQNVEIAYDLAYGRGEPIGVYKDALDAARRVHNDSYDRWRDAGRAVQVSSVEDPK